MAVLKVKKSGDYTVIDNNIFKNRDLSLKAKGLLCLMLSLPDNWDYTLAGLATLSADGVDGTRSALNELEEHSYFGRVQQRDGGKFADIEYIISETPILENPITVNPILENPPQLNTNKSSTNESNIYKQLQDAYNNICTRLRPKVRITAACKKHIKQRLSERSYEDIVLAFRKAQDSDFFCGGGSRGWQGNFDWIMKSEDHLNDLLEGKYDNAENELQRAFEELEEEKNAGIGGAF